MCLTPASSPGAVSPVRGSSSAETIALSWQEPCSNGSDIISYNIDIGDKTMITIPGSVTEYVVKELVPETTYKYVACPPFEIVIWIYEAFSNTVKILVVKTTLGILATIIIGLPGFHLPNLTGHSITAFESCARSGPLLFCFICIVRNNGLPSIHKNHNY